MPYLPFHTIGGSTCMLKLVINLYHINLNSFSLFHLSHLESFKVNQLLNSTKILPHRPLFLALRQMNLTG